MTATLGGEITMVSTMIIKVRIQKDRKGLSLPSPPHINGIWMLYSGIFPAHILCLLCWWNSNGRSSCHLYLLWDLFKEYSALEIQFISRCNTLGGPVSNHYLPYMVQTQPRALETWCCFLCCHLVEFAKISFCFLSSHLQLFALLILLGLYPWDINMTTNTSTYNEEKL